MTVCVLDPQTSLAEALALALTQEPGIARAVAVDDLMVAATVDWPRVDVAVIAVDSALWDPRHVVRWTVQRSARLAVVALSGDEDPDLVTVAVLAGARSWVPKQTGVRELAEVVVGAARGEAFVPPRVLAGVLDRLVADGASRPSRADRFAVLTDREREVLGHAVLGLSRAEIAAEMGISLNTVRTHMHHVMHKLGVHTTLEAVTLVLHEGADGSLS